MLEGIDDSTACISSRGVGVLEMRKHFENIWDGRDRGAIRDRVSQSRQHDIIRPEGHTRGEGR